MHSGKAKWIWLNDAGNDGPGASTVVARNTFDISDLGGDYTLAISANSIYRAYLNGHLIGRGPDRADPRYLYFDRYLVNDSINVGSNVLVIEVRHLRPVPGSRAWCLYGGEAGLLAELSGPGLSLGTSTNWALQHAPGYLDDLEPISRFQVPQAHVDLEAAREIDAMHDAAYDDSSWPRARETHGSLPAPMAREIPLLERRVHHPLSVGNIAPASAAGIETAALLGYMPHVPAQVPPHAKGAWLTLDFGRPMGGFPRLTFEAQGGNVDIYYGEGSRWLLADQLELPQSGTATYEPMDWRGARYVALHFHSLHAPATLLDAAFVEMVYPFEYVSDFQCDNQTLTDTFRTCRLTAHVGVKDHPVDCLWREQALWLADIVIHNRALLTCFGDGRPMEKAVRQAMRVMHDDGVVPVPGPVGLGYQRTDKLLPWSCQPLSISMIVRDLYQFTGDNTLANWVLPRLAKVYEHFAWYEDAAGLLCVKPEGLPELVAFGGWNPTLGEGHPAGLTFRYITSLRAAAEVAAAAGDAGLASTWQRRADAIAAAAHTAFWDAEQNLYSDGIKEGSRLPSYSPSQNGWAAVARVLPNTLAGSWAEAMRHDPPVLPPWSPYDAALLLDGFLAYGLDLHARELLDEYYGSIVRSGEPTLPEFWKHNDPSGWRYHRRDDSHCHAYGAAPAYQCLNTILGARESEPGWRKVSIAPRRLGLNHARGRIATPLGPLGVAWEFRNTWWMVEVDLPTGMQAEVVLPRIGRGNQKLWLNEQVVWTDAGWPATEAAMRLRPVPSTLKDVRWQLQSPGLHRLRLEAT